jgi:hypothetical protein
MFSCSFFIIELKAPPSTSRNQPKCNHTTYNYMRLVVVYD